MNTHQSKSRRSESRRVFLKKTAVAAAAVTGASSAQKLWQACGAQAPGAVSVIIDPADTLAKEPVVQWAISQLRQALAGRGFHMEQAQTLDASAQANNVLLFGGPGSALIQEVLEEVGITLPTVPESLVLASGKSGKTPVLVASGSDARGLEYAVLELADRVRYLENTKDMLRHTKFIVQKPANQIRSIGRMFSSDIEDKPWFNDRSFWESYLTELATQRYNRFNLTLGLGYDFTTDIHDAYFHFSYPFFLSVAGYNVRAVPLPDEERDRNLAMLRFISEQAVNRGLRFQLGLWTHAYKWVNSPKANYVIEGLTPETQAAYCRDALAALLAAVPDISGLTIRIHGESGVAEGSYDFWKTLFDAIAHCGRRLELDMHAKGMEDQMIEIALATGQPVQISPKFWAEHQGLGYMQGAIRPQEMPPRDATNRGFFSRSTGSRRFLRYGYGDLMREDRRYGVVHRVWPGTQRMLMWASPDLAADYGRASSFCGSQGVEWFEPLSFKGRKGSGLPGGRDAYLDSSLRPYQADLSHEKYLYAYRVWGRCMYDPDCNPEEWRRVFNHDFGDGAPAIEVALQLSGRILPLVTTAHCPSAANNNYWPEMYTNMALVNSNRQNPYNDTPKGFAAVSPLDPEFFSRIGDFANDLLKGAPGAKYSPAWVAAVLENFAVVSDAAMAKARRNARDTGKAAYRRIQADVAIQNGLGRFFAWKFRAGVFYSLYEQTGDHSALEKALDAYQKARAAWAGMAELAKPVYRSDITYGPGAFQRGHWLDRLPAIDADIEDMAKLMPMNEKAKETNSHALAKAIRAVEHPLYDSPAVYMRDFHSPPESFRRGAPIEVRASTAHTRGFGKIASIQLRFRRVNQADIWQQLGMQANRAQYNTTIPGDYTNSPYPIQYHFELRDKSGTAWLYPGLKPGWKGQPYFIVRQTKDQPEGHTG